MLMLVTTSASSPNLSGTAPKTARPLIRVPYSIVFVLLQAPYDVVGRIIRAALGLPAPAHSNPLLRDRSVITPPAQQTCSSIILEAEMVAFNETRDCIDEFWRISQMKERDDKSGARWVWPYCGLEAQLVLMPSPSSVMIAESQLESDVSQMTNSTISPGVSPRKQAVKELHFQLVFFDVLLLDGRSLVQGAPNNAQDKRYD